MKHSDFFDNSFKAFEQADKHIEEKKAKSGILATMQFLTLNAVCYILISLMCYFYIGNINDSLFVSLLLTMFIFMFSFVHFVTDGNDNIKEQISISEKKIRENLEQKFFDDIKGNREYLQDLASLVVDEPTHETFSTIVERLSKSSDKNYFWISHCVKKLISQNKVYNAEKNAEEKRNSFLNKEHVSIGYKVPKKEFKENYLL